MVMVDPTDTVSTGSCNTAGLVGEGVVPLNTADMRATTPRSSDPPMTMKSPTPHCRMAIALLAPMMVPPYTAQVTVGSEGLLACVMVTVLVVPFTTYQCRPAVAALGVNATELPVVPSAMTMVVTTLYPVGAMVVLLVDTVTDVVPWTVSIIVATRAGSTYAGVASNM